MRKRSIANTRDAVSDRDIRQVATAIEGIIANARDAVPDCDTRQALAIVERIRVDARDTVRNRDARKVRATGEHRSVYARHSVGKNHILDVYHVINTIRVSIDLQGQRNSIRIAKICNQRIRSIFLHKSEAVCGVDIFKAGGFVFIHLVSVFVNDELCIICEIPVIATSKAQ